MSVLRLLIFGLIAMFLTALSSDGFARKTELLFVSGERPNSLVSVEPSEPKE